MEKHNNEPKKRKLESTFKTVKIMKKSNHCKKQLPTHCKGPSVIFNIYVDKK